MDIETGNVLTQDEILQEAVLDPYSSIRALVKKNLFLFIKYFWSEYSDEKFVPNWHIMMICKDLEIAATRVGNNEKRLYDICINVPPGTTKTAMVSIFFPLWCWVNWHWMRFITASYTQPLSLESAEYSRDIVRSDKWKVIFPEIEIKDDKDTKSNFRVIKKEWVIPHQPPRIRHGGNRFSTSVGGTVTGFHGHINVVDDPIDPNGALSEGEVKKTNHWMNATLPSRKVNKNTTLTILVMQRLHQNDPTGHWMRMRPKSIKHICLPGEIKNYKHLVQPQEWIKYYSDDGLLDPTRLTWDALHEFLLYGQYTYGSQIGQDPVPLGGGMFKVDHLSVIDRIPESHFIVETVRYWDKAGTAGGDGAYTVGAKMAKLKDKSFVVLDIKRGRWSSEERERVIKECATADGTRCRVFVEQEPGSGGKESAEATVKNLSGFMAQKDRPVGDKVYRADPYSVQVNLGNVKILSAKWNADYIDELKNFPQSTFKDQTDASSGAFAKLSARKRAQVGRQ